MGGGVSKTVLQHQIDVARVDKARVDKDAEKLADTLLKKEAELEAKRRVLREQENATHAHARDATQLRKQVDTLVQSTSYLQRALEEIESQKAVADVSLFAITAKSVQERVSLESVIQEMSKRIRAGEIKEAIQEENSTKLQAELVLCREEITRLTSNLQATNAELTACRHSLRGAEDRLHNEVENSKMFARGVIAEADKRIQHVQATYSDASFLRKQLVSMYLGEVCGDVSEHSSLVSYAESTSNDARVTGSWSSGFAHN